MPLCDGFEATRRIRALEEERETLWRASQQGIPDCGCGDDDGRGSRGDPLAGGPAPGPPAWIIGLSAHAGIEDRDEGLVAGMNVFLTKVRIYWRDCRSEQQQRGKRQVRRGRDAIPIGRRPHCFAFHPLTPTGGSFACGVVSQPVKPDVLRATILQLEQHQQQASRYGGAGGDGGPPAGGGGA